MSEYIVWRILEQSCTTSEGKVFEDAYRMMGVELDLCGVTYIAWSGGDLNVLSLLWNLCGLHALFRSAGKLAVLVASVFIRQTKLSAETRKGYIRASYDRVAAMVEGFLTGNLSEKIDGVYARKTGDLKLVVPKRVEVVTPIQNGNANLKIVLSAENSVGPTRAILESIKPEHPLRIVTKDSGREINRLLKSQVLLSSSEGRLSGMGTLVNSGEHGLCILTLGHVIRSCRGSDGTVVVSSPVTNKAVSLKTLNIRRLTTFRVGDVTDSRIMFRVTPDVQSRLSLKAVTEDRCFKPAHGMVFSPPVSSGKSARYSTGLMGDMRQGALLSFAGSTVPGTSGAGVFMGNKFISIHVGAMTDGGDNVSLWNLPRRGALVNAIARASWARTQGINLESAAPDLRILDEVDILDTLADENRERVFEMEDIDMDNDDGTYTRHSVLDNQYARDYQDQLDAEQEERNQERLNWMANSKTPRWADDDDEDNYVQPLVQPDQATQHDEYEAQGHRDHGRSGRHGTTRRSVRFESASPDPPEANGAAEVEDEDDAHPVTIELRRIAEEMKRLKALKKAKALEKGRYNHLDNQRAALNAMREELGLPPVSWGLVKLDPGSSGFRQESAGLLGPGESYFGDLESEESDESDDESDFGVGERPPQSTTAPAAEPLPKNSVSSESAFAAPTATSTAGLAPPRTASSKKKSKKKKRTQSSEGGAVVLESQGGDQDALAGLTRLLVPLTQRLEDMDRQIAALQPQSAP